MQMEAPTPIAQPMQLETYQRKIESLTHHLVICPCQFDELKLLSQSIEPFDSEEMIVKW
jgi:hypothetical protein